MAGHTKWPTLSSCLGVNCDWPSFTPTCPDCSPIAREDVTCPEHYCRDSSYILLRSRWSVCKIADCYGVDWHESFPLRATTCRKGGAVLNVNHPVVKMPCACPSNVGAASWDWQVVVVKCSLELSCPMIRCWGTPSNVCVQNSFEQLLLFEKADEHICCCCMQKKKIITLGVSITLDMITMSENSLFFQFWYWKVFTENTSKITTHHWIIIFSFLYFLRCLGRIQSH